MLQPVLVTIACSCMQMFHVLDIPKTIAVALWEEGKAQLSTLKGDINTETCRETEC